MQNYIDTWKSGLDNMVTSFHVLNSKVKQDLKNKSEAIHNKMSNDREKFKLRKLDKFKGNLSVYEEKLN